MDNKEAEMEVDVGGLSIEVDKPLPMEFDLGTLLVSDTNELSYRSLKCNPEDYLKSLARDNTQLLINEIWKLPFERIDDVVITKLPKASYTLPREKPAPKPKTLTKWEKYAKEKGIKKTKKTKLVWDELVKKWVPRFGYKKAVAEAEKDWCLEVPGNADPMEDQFEKKAEMKAEKVSKNELQRLRNIAKTKKVVVPKAGLTAKEKPSKVELHQAMHVAKKATASLGKFQAKLPKEKPLKGEGKKRKFDPLVMDSNTEKSKNLEVLSKLMSKKPKIDIDKAVGRQIDMREKDAGNKSNDGGRGRGGARGGLKRSEGKRRGGSAKGKPASTSRSGRGRGGRGGARGSKRS